MVQRVLHRLGKAAALQRVQRLFRQLARQVAVQLESQLLHAVVADAQHFFHRGGRVVQQPGVVFFLQAAGFDFAIAVPASALLKHPADRVLVPALLHAKAQQFFIQNAAAQRNIPEGAHARFPSAHDIGKIQCGTADVDHQRRLGQHVDVQCHGLGVFGVQERCPGFGDDLRLPEPCPHEKLPIAGASRGVPAGGTAHHKSVLRVQQAVFLQVAHRAPHKADNVLVPGRVVGKAALEAHAEPVGQRVCIGPFAHNDFPVQHSHGA